MYKEEVIEREDIIILDSGIEASLPGPTGCCMGALSPLRE